MEPTISISRSDLIRAFEKWHADLEKDAAGNLVGTTPDNPSAQADILLGYLGQTE